MRIRIDWKKQLAGLLLTIIFISFTISGLMLINLTFTIAPFTLYGEPVQMTVNVGVVFLFLAVVVLVFLLRRGEK
jgi:hypothetical protein